MAIQATILRKNSSQKLNDMKLKAVFFREAKE